MTFQNHLSQQEGICGISQHRQYKISNAPLKKLLSHTATKDELIVF